MDNRSSDKENQDYLPLHDRELLLQLAREALVIAVRGEQLPELDISSIPPNLLEHGATFVTLMKNEELRGCIGSLEAKRPLAEDVRIHAMAAALEDYRFPPVTQQEIPGISIEISRLTAPQRINYRDVDELVKQINPGVDGVVIKKGIRRATFLPQVWEKVPDIEIFMGMLCRKMGAESGYWQSGGVEIFTYQVEKFCE
jgi:AmmeMemoRadiSam system protein A